MPTQIEFLEDPSHQLTIMKLLTGNRPGLLSQVGMAFATCDLWLHTAKIATIGAKAEDIFFISDNHNQPISAPQQAQLKETLIAKLDEGKPANKG